MTIIFDLDGTMVDSAPLCAEIINAMLAERGSPRRVSASDARRFLTQGGTELVSALLGGDCRETATEVADFRSRYAARPTPAECLFPGVADGLAELDRSGVRMAICSNKPRHLCEKIISDLGLDRYFAVIAGSVPDLPLKPDAALALRALAELGSRPEDCLFVGDSEIDCLTAQAAGIPFVFVTYGYAEPGFTADGHDRVDHFSELLRLASPALPRVA